LLIFFYPNLRSIAQRLDPGQWTEVTGLDIVVTHNYNSTVHTFSSYMFLFQILIYLFPKGLSSTEQQH